MRPPRSEAGGSSAITRHSSHVWTTAVPDATKWEIWDNGTILNPRASLVLSATSGSARTTLTMQQNLYASSQAWVVSNNTQLTVIPIMNNVGDMCLEAPDYSPRIIYRGCQSGERRQSFAVYPDGTIRPDRRRDDCLTALAGPGILGLVTAVCNGGAQQRWSFNRDYTISTLDTGLAIDARNNTIFLYPREARESQMWQAWFF
ncbi:Pulchelin B-chain [Heracleum sosnowskyi]|uniref:Pulchelin B-chain n=1 Tax=Heracleum sosnowskyi TaxID=360622 RepID=A0AAD8HQ72_9APIA|nr:Pulchelin B-chain [Heracleum sosnowskyi]